MLESLTPLPGAVGLGAGTGYVQSYGDPRDLLQILLCRLPQHEAPILRSFSGVQPVLTLRTWPSADMAGRVGRKGQGRKLLRQRQGGL